MKKLAIACVALAAFAPAQAAFAGSLVVAEEEEVVEVDPFPVAAGSSINPAYLLPLALLPLLLDDEATATSTTGGGDDSDS